MPGVVMAPRGLGQRRPRPKSRSNPSLLTLVALLLLLLYVPPAHAQAIPCDALLGMDETTLVLDGFMGGTTNSSAWTIYPIHYLYQSTNCRGCDLLPLATVVGSVSDVCVEVSTNWPVRLAAMWVVDDKNTTLGVEEVLLGLGEKGVYLIKVEPTEPTLEEFRFVVQVMVEPNSRYRPLYMLLWTALGLWVGMWVLGRFLAAWDYSFCGVDLLPRPTYDHHNPYQLPALDPRAARQLLLLPFSTPFSRNLLLVLLHVFGRRRRK